MSIASPRSHHPSITTTSLLWSQQLPLSCQPRACSAGLKNTVPADCCERKILFCQDVNSDFVRDKTSQPNGPLAAASSSSLLSHQSGSHHRPQCACLTHVCDIQGLGVCACTYVPLWLCAKHHTYALHSEPKLGGLSQHSYTSCGIPGHDSIPPQPYKTKNHSVDAMTLQQASNNK